MVPVKIQCACGQRYAFDVEPILGQMPSPVACPGCGADGTAAANACLAQTSPAPPVVAAAPMRAAPMRVAVSVPPVAAPTPSPTLAARGSTHFPPVDREQAQHEARAKILWGDEPDEVIKFLVIKGFHPDEAGGLVGELLKERASTIRVNGIRKIVIGAALVCVPIVSLIVFLSMGYIPLKIFAVTVMVGLWGGWMILKGIFMLLAPKSEAGDVAEH